MNYEDKYAPTSEKNDPKNAKKIILTDFEYAFLAVLNKIADNLGNK